MMRRCDAATLPSWFAQRDASERRAQKWSDYLPPYHRHLGKFCDGSRVVADHVRFLELGVQSGGSMHMWLDYFGPTALGFGADIEPRVRQIVNASATPAERQRRYKGRIRLFVGDQGDPTFLRSICDAVEGGFDFIIDDASHIPWHQVVGFEMLFPCLREHGVYMVEDLGDNFGGRFGHGQTFVEYAKRLSDEVNNFAWASHSKRVAHRWASNISSVHFYPSLIVIEKGRRTKPTTVDKGKLSIPKRTVAFQGVTREVAEAKVREMHGSFGFER